MAVDKLHRAGQAVGGVKGPKVSGVQTPSAKSASNPQVTGDHVARGEQPKAPKTAAAVRAGRFGTVAQAMGRKKDPVETLLAQLDARPSDNDAAGYLADMIMKQLEIA